MRQSYSSDGSTVETMTPKAEPIQGMFVEPGAPAGTDRCAVGAAELYVSRPSAAGRFGTSVASRRISMCSRDAAESR